MNTLNHKVWAVGGASALLIALVAGFFSVANANPLQFVPTIQLATATTSVQYFVTGGQATTTAFDAFATGQPKAIDKGVLLTQYAASSTSSSLNIRFQYSQDGIDWYDDNVIYSSTTTISNASQPLQYQWTATGIATSSKAININFPLRYVRAIYTETGAAGAIWWQFVPQRQSN